ncbi:MAG TPA: TIM barrel protein [Vicinamibacterales bacterium]|nr:TIM barrel protein [Vicinamibacterales bacterium]
MAAIRVANAPCSWGVLEHKREGLTYGYAQVLDEMAATGYAGTELGDWGFMPTDPAALRDELARRNLALVGAYVPVRLTDAAAHDAGRAAAVRTARLLRDTAATDPVIVLADDTAADPRRAAIAGRVIPSDGLPEDAWAVVARGADLIARAVADETGLATVFHHHCATWVETPQEIAALMEQTDPGRLGLCVDTGHLTYGGGDPVALIERYGARVRHVHFKDCDPAIAGRARREGWDYTTAVGRGLFCELGQGAVDFAAVLRSLERVGYTGWIVVEQDVLPRHGTPRASAQRNREYLRTLGL